MLGRRTRLHGCTDVGELPDRRCSPGAVYADAALPLICAAGYAAKMSSVPASEANALFAEYGIARAQRRAYELDHVVPIELGGSNSIANLAPEASKPARAKDKLEKKLHQLVCGGQMKLGTAQRSIASSWTALYKRVFGRAP